MTAVLVSDAREIHIPRGSTVPDAAGCCEGDARSIAKLYWEPTGHSYGFIHDS